MTRKDYIAIAAAIQAAIRGFIPVNAAPTYTAIEVAKGVAEYMERDNPSFDRAKFLQACGVSP